MKKIFAVLIAAVLVATLLCGCFGGGRNINRPDTDETADIIETADIAETETQEDSGKIAFDYVKTMREETFKYSDGAGNPVDQTMTIPEILLDSADAQTVNDEIREKWGKLLDDSVSMRDKGASLYVYDVYYSAYLYEDVLSVYIHASYDGGNEEYSVYNFRVSTGDKLTPQGFFAVLGKDYDQALSDFEDKLSDYYADKYQNLPGNDDMMKQTLDHANLIATPFYADNSGAIYAVPIVYAAVGGGRFAAIIQVY